MTTKTRYDGFRPEAFSVLARVESSNWWFRARNRLILWVLRSRVTGFQRFLEVGCGTGFVLQAVGEAFREAELSASEYFEAGLGYARERVPDANFIQLDARAMDEVGVWDVIGAFDVLEHIAEDELVLANLARALVPSGWLLVTVPQHPWLWSAVDERACHQRRYTRRELLAKVQATGLKIEYVTSFVSLLVPLMWLSRRQRRDRATQSRSEFDLPPWLNRSLGLVMALEFGLIRLGLPLPVGGSLMVLARK